MARKCKVGIDYFSHDVEMMSDPKIRFIKAKHGLLGYAVFLRLLEETYKEKGYYLENGEKFNILFIDENKIDLDVYINILNDCINENLFDINLYKKYGILTSKRIQLNYLSVAERRKSIDLIQEYLLVNIMKYNNDNKNKLNANIISLNDNINKENVNKSTQSKVKESKEKNKEPLNFETENQKRLEEINEANRIYENQKYLEEIEENNRAKLRQEAYMKFKNKEINEGQLRVILDDIKKGLK